jgi:hypothetical protein
MQNLVLEAFYALIGFRLTRLTRAQLAELMRGAAMSKFHMRTLQH